MAQMKSWWVTVFERTDLTPKPAESEVVTPIISKKQERMKTIVNIQCLSAAAATLKFNECREKYPGTQYTVHREWY